MAVEAANDCGEVSEVDGGLRFGDELIVFGGLRGIEALDHGGDVLVAEVENAEGHGFGGFGDLAADERLADDEAHAAGHDRIPGEAAHGVAEEVGLVGIAGEDGTDGVMGGDLLEADLHAADVAVVDGGAVLLFGDVTFCCGELVDEFLFEGGGTLAEELGGELQDAAGVGDDLHGLDAGDVVEEPAAAGVHEHGVALELHEHEGAGAFFFVELVAGRAR